MPGEFSSKVSKYAFIAMVSTGIVLILIAAFTAYTSFYGYSIPRIEGSSVDEAVISLVYSLTDLAARLGFLGIMVWAGGILLKYGIQLLKK
ncbi:MAG: hypothetical protein QXJ97_09495 [Desulfurococcaceae archaeon]